MANKANDVERANPLPVGKYWVVITGKDAINQFNIWLDASAATGSLRVDSTQVLSQSGIIRKPADLLTLLIPVWGVTLAASRASDPDQVFYVFSVLNPNQVVWIVAFGLPSKAAPDVQSVDDVEQAPVVEDPLKTISNAIGSIDTNKALVIGGVVIAGVVIYEWFKRKD